MVTTLENLQVGTFGCHHDDWGGKFYPEDLPKDWQFDFFNTIFKVLLVPQTEWLNWGEAALEEIADAMVHGFHLYFAAEEALSIEQVEQLKNVIRRLKRWSTGLVVWGDDDFTETNIAGLPVTLISTNRFLPGWCWQNKDIIISGNPLGLVGSLSKKGKDQVALLQSFVASLPTDRGYNDTGVAFIVAGDKIDIQQVTNLKIVGEILGY